MSPVLPTQFRPPVATAPADAGTGTSGGGTAVLTIGQVWAQCSDAELSVLSAALDSASDRTRLAASTMPLIKGSTVYSDLRAVFATTGTAQSRIDELLPP